MAKNKRNADLKNADEKTSKDVKNGGGKGWRTGVATLTICAAAFGAYYSPDFRTASSGWLERGRALIAKTSSTGGSAEENGAADDELSVRLAQAPSFRDFLTDEYGEEGARELLGGDETSTDVPSVSDAGVGFSDYAAAESNASEPVKSQNLTAVFNEPSLPTAPEPSSSFADYVAAESSALEPEESQSLTAVFNESSLPTAPEPSLSFADYVAAENADDVETDGTVENVGSARLASAVEPVATSVFNESETALAARLEAEMKERGVGNPRVERWGGRFWRASGFATTIGGVATFCEAVDVDPTAAQRAALEKFDAAKF